MQSKDDQEKMREALRRDATRITDPPFDAPLHHATLRRIRALTAPQQRNSRRNGLYLIGASAAALVIAYCAVPWRILPSSQPAVPRMEPALAVIRPPQASAWAYQAAAAGGDEALGALLDHDAGSLLPPTAASFSISPN